MKLFAPLHRIVAIFIKEAVQMRRDRLTFVMMLAIPVVQLVLFGFAINTDPKNLPTAVQVQEYTPLVRTIINGFKTSGYYDLVIETNSPATASSLLAKGEVVFVITIPAGFSEQLVRGERPQLLIQADASDPAATSNAIAQAGNIINKALRHDLKGALSGLTTQAPAFELIVHPQYNPEGITQYNIVPGLLGVILTMTMVMITGMAMTREAERGTLENLLAMPATPPEMMLGKTLPYVVVGGMQTAVVLLTAHFIFAVPFAGEMWLLLTGVGLFVLANLALGFTFSTIAKSQLQAMQLTFFFFLPSMLLTGFMFPFRGMPVWAQTIGEVLPLTHFLRLVRGVMLKGLRFDDVQNSLLAIVIFTLVMGTIAMLRYRRTLD